MKVPSVEIGWLVKKGLYVELDGKRDKISIEEAVVGNMSKKEAYEGRHEK